MTCSRRINCLAKVLLYVLLLQLQIVPLVKPFSISRAQTNIHGKQPTTADTEKMDNDRLPTQENKTKAHNIDMLVTLLRRARSLRPKSKTSSNGTKLLAGGVNRTITLWSRIGYHLAILDDGTVAGTKDHKSDKIVFHAISYGNNNYALQSVKLKRYVAMDKQGNVYSTKVFNKDDVVFKVVYDFLYTQFASEKHFNHKRFDMLLGFRNMGKPKKGKKTSASHRSTRFDITYL